MKFGCNRSCSFRGEVIWNCGRTTDGRTTDDGRRTTEPAYTISSPGAFGSGELIKSYNRHALCFTVTSLFWIQEMREVIFKDSVISVWQPYYPPNTSLHCTAYYLVFWDHKAYQQYIRRQKWKQNGYSSFMSFSTVYQSHQDDGQSEIVGANSSAQPRGQIL